MKFSYYIILLIMCLSCVKKKETTLKVGEVFVDINSKASGIDFSNILTENDSINYFNYGYMYMGGGVAIGDVNNDGLQDVYFTGNMVENKLYLNKGDLSFEDITESANVAADDRWVTGVTMADVNADGWLDMYVSVSGIWTTTKNLLYINKGLDENGIPIFIEAAESYGIADSGNSVQGTFFDYDNDGDLDLYVINYPPTDFRTTVPEYNRLMHGVTEVQSNTLYRNNGDNTFTNVTEASGLLSFGLSLSAAIGDYNSDGWQDIYVSNDFASPDNFYFNNGDGTFTDQIKKTINQTAFFGMGSDVADFNNDGLLDFFQLDMTPEDNRRSKANMQSMNVQMFNQMDHYGFHTQFMHNTLQLNVGNDENELPLFSNVPRLGGVALTDWSWAALFADFDNDGWKDLFVTNGTRREINNKDYFKKIGKQYSKKKKEGNILPLVEAIPSEKIENYAFKNNGDLTFSKIGKKWGVNHKGFSNGAAYADLDNDGDLDLVVNNLDEVSKVYKNTTTENNSNNYLKINLKGTEKNPLGIGTKVFIYSKGKVQLQQVMNTRGFQSAVPSILNFGLGKATTIDSLKVIWPDGRQQNLVSLGINKQIDLNYSNSNAKLQQPSLNKNTMFKDVTKKTGISYKHKENKFDDYFYQVLLPNKMSQFGPALAVGDVNNDGLEDFYIGGASRYFGNIYFQNLDETFTKQEVDLSWKDDDIKEDVNAIFFDANNDGYQDLYVVSGGNEFHKNSKPYQDRLYINDKKGNLIKNNTALPKMYISGSKVVPADFDNDGDLDLFVGGRHTPRNYPLPTNSFILRNDSSESEIIFTDITKEVATDLQDIGMVTDATWTDFNGDNILDLVVVGEWMPITFFANENGKFINKTNVFGFEKSTGWWNTIIAKDFDNDGDIDFVAGNLGLNYKYRASEKETFDVYADDFDNNKSTDIVLGYYYDGEQYPVRGRQCSSQQIPAIEIKFKDYNSFAKADIEDVYSTQSLKDALHYKAYTFASSYIENLGNGNFKTKALPNEAQVSSINSILSKDVNDDGHIDLIVSGNLYTSEVETPRNDASYGLYLQGNGLGEFKPMPATKSGLYVKGDVKNSAWIKLSNGMDAILFAKNNDSLQLEKVSKIH
ncbi:VCBS repeat-containing protein [Sabulilitoribacter arenilitoris]|uniref:VCBS repeat-containing protein n=1 Tax=Wocania arenilitoris TaxID=2044858 RepID=A0AAE3EP53_9FLAO|nr:VCBS repeat-containing protein [Wocania arenilitoris]MCF7567977.1 VCBS repeat-containing protein [Wocania arenilitoris]